MDKWQNRTYGTEGSPLETTEYYGLPAEVRDLKRQVAELRQLVEWLAQQVSPDLIK